jgi:hypothetical protein
MSSQRLQRAIITLCLLLSFRLGVAIDPGISPSRVSLAATTGQTDTGASATPAMVALPANEASAPAHANATHGYF